VGRDAEVAATKELLLRQDVRLVTITGPGGIGKTRLAVQVASAWLGVFQAAPFYSALLAEDPRLLVSVIVQTLGIREGGSQSPLEILQDHLQSSSRAPVLLLLDNFEHLARGRPLWQISLPFPILRSW